MPNLLTCLSEPGIASSCCETPYQPVMSDCVLDCLVREQQRVSRDLRVTYGGMLEFGTKEYKTYENQLQDLQLLTTFLYDLFVDRVASVAGGNDDWVVADAWAEHDLGCVADYFRCRYKLDIRPWLLHAGLYDPAHPPTAAVIAQLPIPYEVPCGTNVPVPPDPDPPLEEDCIIPTFMIVSGAVDSSYEAQADPLSTYLIRDNIMGGSGGWNDQVGTIAAPGNFITPPDPSNIGVQGSDQIWVVAGGSVEALFPIISGSIIGQALTLSITPIVTSGMTLLLQVSDGSTYETVYSGDPASLATNYTLVMTGAVLLRARYTYQGCTYGPFDTDVDDGCGNLQATFTPGSLCGTNTWELVVDVIALDDYAGGTINAVVNGVAQGASSLGTGATTYGPFDPGDEVHFVITHPTVLGCGFTTQDYTDPTTPPDLAVFLPVLFTQNTLTLVYMVSLPAVDPDLLVANPNITIVYDCGSGDVEVYNGPLNSFADMPIFPQPSCNIDTITGAIIYDQDCDVRIDAELDTFTPTDPVAGPTVGLNGGVNSSFQGPGGSYYVGGFFDHWDPTGVNVVANRFTRLNPDGTLDSTFNNVVSNPLAFTPGFNADLRDLAVDSLGRIVCVGSFTAFNDVSAARIIRINPDGTRDNTFVIGTGFDSTVNGVSIDSANNVICTGAFTTYDGVFVGHIVRLTTTGAIDTTFNYDTGLSVPYASFGTSGNSYRNVIDTDGSIIVNSGQASFDAYTDVSGTTIVLPDWSLYKKGVVRLNTNGTLNSIITQGAGVLGALVGPGAPTQNSFAIQSNGDIICTGAFTTYNGVTVNRIVRMDAAGNIDMGFLANTGTGFDTETAGIAVLPGGKILIGCNGGALFNGAFTGGLVLLNSNGTRDNSLNLGTGFNGMVVDICITITGRIIVGGTFTTLNSLPAWYVQQF